MSVSRRHVASGRGHTSYHCITDPHPGRDQLQRFPLVTSRLAHSYRCRQISNLLTAPTVNLTVLMASAVKYHLWFVLFTMQLS